MRKNVFGRKFKRDKNQRTALFKGLMSSLVMYGKIKTTEAKSKAIKGEVDKLVTRARKDVKLARRLLEPHLTAEAVDKFLAEVVPVFRDRDSGFTKTVRLGNRLKDNASLVLMTWTDEIPVKSEKLKVKSSGKTLKGKPEVKEKPKRVGKTAEKAPVKKTRRKK
ncbi:MAG: 50S ribosomal protein L17 [Candidatus Levyibacteriota bacterium]